MYRCILLYYHDILGAVVFADSSQFGIAEFTTAILMDNVWCMGNERKLIDCNYDSDSDCYHIEDVGIRCEMNGQNSQTYLFDYLQGTLHF